MSKRWILFFVGLALVLLLLGIWLTASSSDGVISKGAESNATLAAYVSLATSAVSLLTAVAGLVKAILEARRAAKAGPKV